MSEDVHAFVSKISKDEALQQKLLAGISGDDPKAVVAQVVSVAADAGFTFTAEEYEEAQRAHLQEMHTAGKISDEDLDKVSVGKCQPGIAGDIGTALASFFTFAFKGLGCPGCS